MKELLTSFFTGNFKSPPAPVLRSPEHRPIQPVPPSTHHNANSLTGGFGTSSSPQLSPALLPKRRPAPPLMQAPGAAVYKPEFKEKIVSELTTPFPDDTLSRSQSLYDIRNFQKRRRGMFGKELRRLIAVQELAIKARAIDYAVEDALDISTFENAAGREVALPPRAPSSSSSSESSSESTLR